MERTSKDVVKGILQTMKELGEKLNLENGDLVEYQGSLYRVCMVMPLYGHVGTPVAVELLKEGADPSEAEGSWLRVPFTHKEPVDEQLARFRKIEEE